MNTNDRERLETIVRETYNRFTYHTTGGNDFRFLDNRGDIAGDCLPFALTVIRMYYGSIRKAVWAMLKGEARIWYCLFKPGVGHAVGMIEGVYFDNTGAATHRPQEFRYAGWRVMNVWELICLAYPKAALLPWCAVGLAIGLFIAWRLYL